MNKKNTFLTVISMIVLGIYFIIPTKEVITIVEDKPIDKQIIIKILNSNNVIEEIELEEYIIGVVAAEMPASFNVEALKAQAIAARTYALYKINQNSGDYDVTTDVTTQSYITINQMKLKWNQDFDIYYSKIQDAVEETKDQVLTYNNEIICAFYYSMSNGYTESAVSVFSENLEYIKPVESLWDKNVNNYEVTNIYSKTDMCDKLNISCEKIDISEIEKNNSGRVDIITINNKVFTGVEIRNLLSLRSTDFDILVDENVTITTRGYGHGVGMSQYGANEMSKLGYSYEEILKYYYNQVEIENINV